MDARSMLRSTEFDPATPLGVSQARTLAREIADAVRDPKMHPSIPMKAARAVVDRRISAAELAQLLDHICAHRAGIDSPGAYFCACLKRIFQANEVPWR